MTESTEGFRLSPLQRHLTRCQGPGDRNAFVTHAAVTARGPLDPERFEAALRDVCQMHEILRTRLETLPGMKMPVQVIEDTVSIDVDRLEPRSGEPHRERVERALAESRRRCTERGKGLCAVLLPNGQDQLIVLAHASMYGDARSIQNLLRDAARAYAGEEPPDSDADDVTQYADASEWLNSLADDAEAEAAVERFREVLKRGAPSELRRESEAPFARFAPEKLTRQLDAALRTRLGGLAERLDIPEWAVCLAVFQLVVWRRRGDARLVMGLVGDGRAYDELEPALGLFARSVPIHATIEPDLAFGDWARRGYLDAHPLLEVQEYFDPDSLSEAGGAGYFPVEFESRQAGEPYTAGPVSFRIEDFHGVTTRSTLRLCYCQDGAQSRFEFIYDAARLSEQEVRCIADSYEVMLNAVMEDAELRLGEIPFLHATERRKLLIDFNPAPLARAEWSSVVARFEACVQDNPEKAALIAGDENLSYGELDRRAARLAGHLVERGVTPGTLVGICLDAPAEWVVAIWAILKARAAYLPLDASYPEDRLSLMLRDSGAGFVVTEQRLLERLSSPATTTVLLDAQTQAITSAAPLPSLGALEPDDLAYVIYTSGSTGRPKGVEVTHKNLSHSTWARHAHYQHSPERYLLLSSFSFDSSVAGIFWTLTSGGALVVPEPGQERDATALVEQVRRHGVTTLLALPSLYHLVLSEAETGSDGLGSLRTAVVAGEACPKSLVRRHRELLPDAELHNEYGPTEGTVWATVYDTESFANQQSVPIGHPIENARVYLLDEHLRPVAWGAPGELFIAGDGLARGYRNRPDVTAQRFIENPLVEESGKRLYQSGDLARHNASGELEFLGRVDDQIKLRGYRIELGEVEAVLAAHDDVSDVAVAVHELHSEPTEAAEGSADGRTLVAHVVAEDTSEFDARSLREHARARLPEYMVPGLYSVVDTLPRMPNGKVDRKALPDPETDRRALSGEYVAPSNPVEELLSEIWAEVLHLERVGVRDNFFDIGGNSLIVAQLVARWRDLMQTDLPLRAVFEQPTIEELSRVVLSDRPRAAGIERVARLILETVSEADA